MSGSDRELWRCAIELRRQLPRKLPSFLDCVDVVPAGNKARVRFDYRYGDTGAKKQRDVSVMSTVTIGQGAMLSKEQECTIDKAYQVFHVNLPSIPSGSSTLTDENPSGS